MGSSPTGSTSCSSGGPGWLSATAPKLWTSKSCQSGGVEPLWLRQRSYEPQVVGSSPKGSTVCSSAEPGCLCATAPKLWASKRRQRGGIEPLCITAPRELKSRPGTSLSHPGLCKITHRFRWPKTCGSKVLYDACQTQAAQIYIGSLSSVVRAMVL